MLAFFASRAKVSIFTRASVVLGVRVRDTSSSILALVVVTVVDVLKIRITSNLNDRFKKNKEIYVHVPHVTPV